MSTPPQTPGTHFGHLDTPVEQELGADAVAVLTDVVEEGAQRQELGHQLQLGARADAQQPHDVGMVQAADGQHVLRGQRQPWLSPPIPVGVPQGAVSGPRPPLLSVPDLHQ